MERDDLTGQVRKHLLCLRDRHDISDLAWARAADVKPQDLYRFVKGQMAFPPLTFLDRLAQVFDIRLADVLGAVQYGEQPQPKLTLSEEEAYVVRKLRTMTARFKQIHFDLIEAAPSRGRQRPSKGVASRR